MHKRGAIRQQFVTKLTGLATTQDRVTVGLAYPETVPNLPAIDITTTSEQLDESQATASVGNYQQARLLEVTVTARAAGDSYLDTLDQIAFEAETAIMADPTFGGLIDWVEADTMELNITGEIEKPVAVMEIIFEVRYQVNAQDPQ